MGCQSRPSKMIRRISPEKLGFIVSELEGKAVEAAQHRTQCRVLERVIEHFPNSQIEKLVQELLDGAKRLCKHTFGNFIVQSILAHGTPIQRACIVDIVVEDVN